MCSDFLEHVTSNSQGKTARHQFYPPARKQYELNVQWFVAVTCTPSRGRQGSPQPVINPQVHTWNSITCNIMHPSHYASYLKTRLKDRILSLSHHDTQNTADILCLHKTHTGLQWKQTLVHCRMLNRGTGRQSGHPNRLISFPKSKYTSHFLTGSSLNDFKIFTTLHVFIQDCFHFSLISQRFASFTHKTEKNTALPGINKPENHNQNFIKLYFLNPECSVS